MHVRRLSRFAILFTRQYSSGTRVSVGASTVISLLESVKMWHVDCNSDVRNAAR